MRQPKETPLWHKLALKATEETDIKIKINLLKKSVSLKPIQSWPLILLSELLCDTNEIIGLALQAIKIDNNLDGYFLIYKKMSELGCDLFLKNELKKINFELIPIEKRKQFKLLGKNLKNKNFFHELHVTIDEFLKISNIHKNHNLVSLKGVTLPDNCKKIIPFFIKEGKIIIDQKEITNYFEHVSRTAFKKAIISSKSIKLILCEELYFLDFLVLENEKLIIGYEHTFMSNNSSHVKYAGRFAIDNYGNLILLDSKSGHYRPTEKEMHGILDYLKAKKINTELVITKFY